MVVSLMKVKTSTGCDWSTAMDWVLMAKKCMQSVHGYSPHQLVFGQNPNLPSVLTDRAPVLEGTTKSEWVASTFQLCTLQGRPLQKQNVQSRYGEHWRSSCVTVMKGMNWETRCFTNVWTVQGGKGQGWSLGWLFLWGMEAPVSEFTNPGWETHQTVVHKQQKVVQTKSRENIRTGITCCLSQLRWQVTVQQLICCNWRIFKSRFRPPALTHVRMFLWLRMCH